MPRIFTPQILLLIIILSSCSSISYIGQSYAATDKIDVFISEQAIKRPFQYIGKGYLSNPTSLTSHEKIQQMAEALGKKKGADAVLITDYLAPNTGERTITTVNKTDSTFHGTIHTGTTVVSPSVQSGFHILYIKYN